MTKLFVENMNQNPSRFRNDDGEFYLEGHGYDGSIVPLPQKLQDDPFLQRAEKRGRIRFLYEDDARNRMAELVTRDLPHEAHQRLINQSLAEDASDQVSLYQNPNLPTEAREQGVYDPDQIWRQREQTPQTAQGRPQADTVQEPRQPEATATQGAEGHTDPESGEHPDPSQFLTDTIREGEMPPDTGTS